MSGWDFSDVEVRGADLDGTGITTEQLYSTTSYLAGNLTGIGLSGNDLSDWDFAGRNRTDVHFGSATVRRIEDAHEGVTEAVLRRDRIPSRGGSELVPNYRTTGLDRDPLRVLRR